MTATVSANSSIDRSSSNQYCSSLVGAIVDAIEDASDVDRAGVADAEKETEDFMVRTLKYGCDTSASPRSSGPCNNRGSTEEPSVAMGRLER